jgi:tetratricopeptide (TPR) repeat protein
LNNKKSTTMQFDPNNNTIKLCAEGMSLEGEGKKEAALQLFQQAWAEASNDFEKFTAAHYVARQQKSVADKLDWDQIALHHALKINDEGMKGTYPSLYLNIGKGYEDLNDFESARANYATALSFTAFLPEDGYGQLIKGGILNGIERVK